MTRFTEYARLTALTVLATTLVGCSTVGDRLGGLNPFGGKDDNSALGDIPDESDRLTILALGDELTVGSTLTPEDIKLPAPYVNVDWQQPGGNQYHAMQHTAASGNLSRAWSQGVGKGSSAKGRVIAQPVVAGGLIFTVDGENLVRASDAATGKRVWDYKVSVDRGGKTRTGDASVRERISRFSLFGDKGGDDREAIGGGIAVDNGRLFVSSGFGLMVALDAKTGSEIWATETRTPLHSAPAVSGGRAFAVSDDNEIFAFDAATGQVLWTYQGIIESARMLTSPAPAVVDDVVLAPFASGELVALRAQNGGVLWQDALSSSGRVTPLSSLNDIAAGPVVADGYVFASAQSGVMSAFDFRTGQRVWTQPAGALGFPLIAGEFLYLVTTDSNIVCLSRTDGSVIWMTQLDLYENAKKKEDKIAWSGPVLAGDRLFVAGTNGQALTINPYNGVVQDTIQLGDAVFVPPLIANETVYVITDDAKLIALR